MKNRDLNLSSGIGLLTAALFAMGGTARPAETPALKNVYQNHFYVGAAINRATSVAVASGSQDKIPGCIASETLACSSDGMR